MFASSVRSAMYRHGPCGWGDGAHTHGPCRRARSQASGGRRALVAGRCAAIGGLRSGLRSGYDVTAPETSESDSTSDPDSPGSSANSNPAPVRCPSGQSPYPTASRCCPDRQRTDSGQVRCGEGRNRPKHCRWVSSQQAMQAPDRNTEQLKWQEGRLRLERRCFEYLGHTSRSGRDTGSGRPLATKRIRSTC